MKKIEAIIRPEMFHSVKEALSELGFEGLTVTEVKSYDNQESVTGIWYGKKFRIDLLSKTKIEIIVEDADVEKIVSIVTYRARTGNIGDGKVFILDVESIYCIRTKESDKVAIL